MNITLPPEMEEYITRKVQSGDFPNPSEVIGAALDLLRQRDEEMPARLEELRREIALGIQEAEQGKVAPLSASDTLARTRNFAR